MELTNGTVKLGIKLIDACTPPCQTTSYCSEVKLSQAVPTPYLAAYSQPQLHELAKTLPLIYTTPRRITWASLSQCLKLSSMLYPAVDPFALCTLLICHTDMNLGCFRRSHSIMRGRYFSPKVLVLYIGAQPFRKRHKRCPARCLNTVEGYYITA